MSTDYGSSDPTAICCYAFWGEKSLKFQFLLPFVTVHVLDGCPWHTQALSVFTELFSMTPLCETAGQKVRGRKEREEERQNVPTWVWHGAAGLIHSPWQPCRRGRRPEGTPWLFGEVQCAVLTSVPSPLSVGQILEYQWSDWVSLAVVLRTVPLTWEELDVLPDLLWPASSPSLLSEQKGWFHGVKQHSVRAHAFLPPASTQISWFHVGRSRTYPEVPPTDAKSNVENEKKKKSDILIY